MHVTITAAAPAHDAIHVDFAGATTTSTSAHGVVLTLTDPHEILRAARSAARYQADWVVWSLESLPLSERRAAAFAVALGRAACGRVFVVLADGHGRRERIIGHLLAAGCGRDSGSVSV